MKVVLVEKSGRLATELRLSAPAGAVVESLERDDIDITNIDLRKQKLQLLSPNVVINTADYTAGDKAESHLYSAFVLNHLAVKNLVNTCHDLECRFVYVSTDVVFDGKKNTSFKTTDNTNPLSVYGSSKLVGEIELCLTKSVALQALKV